MKHPLRLVLGAIIVMLMAWWLSVPAMHLTMWVGLLIALFVALARLWHVSVGTFRLRLQVKSMQSELNQLNRQVTGLKAEAWHDKLTGLGNRNLLDDRFVLARGRAARNNATFALLMIDLNDFKSINDHYGHAAGDEVLVAVANRLSAAVRGTDTVVRLGGDEFVVLVEDAERPEGLFLLGQKLMETFSKEVELSNRKLVPVGASMGMARFPVDGTELIQLLDLADRGMYECKASTRIPLGRV